jgi:hypothetical protein
MLRCSIESHQRLKLDPDVWASMEYVGVQEGIHDANPPYDLELRNCTCGSTLAKRIPVDKGARLFGHDEAKVQIPA